MFRVLALAIVLFAVACTTEPDRSYWFIESYHDGVLKARLHEGPDKSTTYIAVCDSQSVQGPLLKISRITEPSKISPAYPIPDPTPRISPARPVPNPNLETSPTVPIPDQTPSSCDIVAGFVGKGFPVENQERDIDAAVIITVLTTGGEPSGGYPGDSLMLHGKRGGFSETFRIVSVTR
jgi:hypothetical protein